MMYYIWTEGGDCDNATDDIEVARRIEKEFLDEGRDPYITDENGTVLDETFVEYRVTMHTPIHYPKGRDGFALSMARVRLTKFVISHAETVRRQCGFGFVEVDHAPETYSDLMEAWADSCLYRIPLPIFKAASDSTIYTSKAGNWAFRFWHDVTHCVLKADFSQDGETATALAQLEVIADRFGADSLEFALFHADTIGQVSYYARTGGFVENQMEFVSGLCGIAA